MTDAPQWFWSALETPYDEATVQIEGCPIHYLRWGDVSRPAVVLVHGGAAHAHWWSFIAPLLMREYQVLALDLSGHGDSGRRAEYPRDLWSREIMGVARHAGVPGPPILVGHSMGGFVCINTAAEFGGELAGAIVVDSPVKRPDPEMEEGTHGKSFRNPKVYPTREKALARYRLIPEQPCENGFILDHVAGTSVGRVENGWTWKFDPAIFLNVTPRTTRELLPRVKCRVALIRAEFGLVTPDIGDYMYELLHRRAPVIEIPQAHHHLMLDQPLAFVSVLRALLADWEHSIPARRS